MWTEKIGIVCIIFFSAICIINIRKELRIDSKGLITHRLTNAKEKKTITAEYLLSYILPLFAFDFTLWSEVVLFLIFFITLGYLCIRHNYFSVNVILEMAGYRIYDCQVINEDGIKINYEIISPRKLNGHIGEEILLKALNNEYKLEVV